MNITKKMIFFAFMIRISLLVILIKVVPFFIIFKIVLIIYSFNQLSLRNKISLYHWTSIKINLTKYFIKITNKIHLLIKIKIKFNIYLLMNRIQNCRMIKKKIIKFTKIKLKNFKKLNLILILRLNCFKRIN
jgi:hypothetical protein